MKKRQWVRYALVGGVGLLTIVALALSASNGYVTVSCDTAGVEDIVAIDVDFYITTRGVSAPDFVAGVGVSADLPWKLVEPASGSLELGIGESGSYRVEDETGKEDEAGGNISVLKLDIEQTETNVCWKSSGVTLNLTADSVPGGTAIWSSQPEGIRGSGSIITFNPSGLTPGAYVVTATSGIVPSYSDICVVRVIKVDIEPTETNVCGKTSDASLNLTADSYLDGGTAEWTSEPAGIGGSGPRITFNPSGLTPTSYVVTARSSVLTNCSDTCTVNILSVNITGFSPPYTYARATGCPVAAHQATCQATIDPPGVSTITYSIQNEASGATIDANTGCITPSITESGEITVRAAATVLPDCYDEETFLIKARPTTVHVSTATKDVVPVGGEWVHTFLGTGGSLEGAQIVETVTMTSWPFRDYDPVTGGSWTLNSLGTMTVPDSLRESGEQFDINDFLPSPPKSGLPQSSLEHQEFDWICPMCWGARRDIEQGQETIIFTLLEDAESETGYAVTIATGYNASGEPIYFVYRGDPLP